MHPRTIYIIMMALLAVMVGLGHYENASQIGSVKWFAGVAAGLLFGGVYFLLKSKLLNTILMVAGFALFLIGAFCGYHISDPSNRIALSAFVFGMLAVMVWRGVRLQMVINEGLRSAQARKR